MQNMDHPTTGDSELHRALEIMADRVERYLGSSEPIDDKFRTFCNQFRHYVRMLGEGKTTEWLFHLRSYDRALSKLWRNDKVHL